MKRVKMILVWICILGALTGGVFGWYAMRNWPMRFHRELDAFFGEGRWQVLSESVETSRMYRVYRSTSLPQDGHRPGKYHNWTIAVTDSLGRETAWRISDHAYRIRRSRNSVFHPQWVSARDALAVELLDCAMMSAGETLQETVLAGILSPEERDCLRVEISYRGGNPQKPGRLFSEPWFTADGADVRSFLESDLADFYIDIFAYDYEVQKLSETDRSHLKGSLSEIQQALRDTYGDDVDYEIYLGPEHKAESQDAENAR